MFTTRLKNLAVIFFSILILLSDQLFKFLSIRNGQGEVNTGFSWSVGADWSAEVTILASLVVIALIWFNRKKISRLPELVTVLCLAGLFNLSDRLIYGGVVDYLSVPWFGLRNNLADWVIFLCICVLMGELGYEQYRGRNQKK